ncbi:MAG: hypothetical protein ACD_69C00273G0002 [uncultured bacterium]|nr:MAG: hypothetical protein ACD_69C00273G0002 [uncultured bacterium]OGT09774.1 MAG: hypothetical protein A2V89_02845 [Gammaproteobacteria bacterium RBG_16_37_9]HBS52207.1 tyrosine-specific transport protein [Coxiellaceae bacterium]HBY55698.1 tyrosine-specific transport protein [Coxiellaceae bacterium]
MNKSKFIGSTMILTGSIIGAGMLGQPMVSAACGFTWASVIMFASWAIAAVTGLIVIEVTLALPIHSCSFGSMAEQTLGRFGKVVTWVSYLLVLYAITVAYIGGETSGIINAFGSAFPTQIPHWTVSILFTVILGSAVFWSTKATDHINRSLISVKGFMLIAALAFIMPHVDISKLIDSQNLSTQSIFLWSAIPVFANAFFYQFVIPSLRIYIGDEPRQLKWIVMTGTTIALVVYLLWLAAALGTIPLEGDNSFTSLARTPGSSVGEFTQLMIHILNNKWVTTSINGFANIAMTTSFLGISLSLFDFLADGFKRPDTRFGRLQTAGLTFIPPLTIALFFPNIFITAMNYAAIPIAVLSLIIPALMVYKLRKHPTLKSPYRVKYGNTVFFVLILTGFALIALSIVNNLHLLPTLK